MRYIRTGSLFLCALAVGLFSGQALGESARDAHIRQMLDHFQRDSMTFMNQKVSKFRPHAAHQRLQARHAQAGHHVTVKSWHRHKHQKITPQGREAAGYNDQAQNLVDKFTHKTLEAIESAKLMSAKLAETPWSDYYWAIYNGVLSYRYADSSMSYTSDWKKNTDQVLKDLSKPLTPAKIDVLSPAEKYDLLVGDTNKTLTKASIEEGRQYWSPSKPVETWMGICHGWAPAAYNVQRPKNLIKVTAADGKTVIPFYPADIRGLASLLWANANPQTKFVGGRCNLKNPPQDASGRIKDQSCRDTNPATWHLVVVNQIGVSRRSMVIDCTFDYEVWNQPFHSYSYTYFNPQTNQPAATLAAAKVTKAQFTKDKFKQYRNSKTASIVGIAMDAVWVVENRPSHDAKNSATNDYTNGARYMYDLELDAQGNIIGGEWYQNAHPDFIWHVPPGVKARAYNEPSGTWDAKTAFPAGWKSAAASASRNGMPLGKAVDALAGRSNKGL
jgi:hypothetical protein